MKPDAATAWEDALSRLRKAQKLLEDGDRSSVVTECQNTICSACCAIKLAGFGDPWSTFSGLSRSFPSDPHQAIARTHDILSNLRQMAPDEDPFPSVGA